MSLNVQSKGKISNEAYTEFYDEEVSENLASFDFLNWLKEKGKLDQYIGLETDRDSRVLNLRKSYILPYRFKIDSRGNGNIKLTDKIENLQYDKLL